MATSQRKNSRQFASPDLRKLALRMYGDSVLELLGEEIIPETAVDEPDLDLEMRVIPETVPVVRASIDSASARKSGVNTSSGKSGILLTLGGIGGLGIGLTNVYWDWEHNSNLCRYCAPNLRNLTQASTGKCSPNC